MCRSPEPQKGFNFVTGSLELEFPQGKREARFLFDMDDGDDDLDCCSWKRVPTGYLTTLQVKEPTGWKHGTLSDFKTVRAFLKGKDNVLAGMKNYGWIRTSKLPDWIFLEL